MSPKSTLHRSLAALVAVLVTAAPLVKARAQSCPPPPDPTIDGLVWDGGCAGDDDSVDGTVRYTVHATGQRIEMDLHMTQNSRGEGTIHADYYDAGGLLLASFDLKGGKAGLTMTERGRGLAPAAVTSMMMVFSDSDFADGLQGCLQAACPRWKKIVAGLCIAAATVCCAFGVGPCCAAAPACALILVC
jgi:hypothetical protein